MPEARLSKPRYEDVTACKSQYAEECPPPVEQPLTAKCKELLEITQSIEGSTEYLKIRLFGGGPALNTEVNLEPCSLDDILNALRNSIESIGKTIVTINERV